LTALPAQQIPLAEPDLSGNEARYLQECIDTTFVSSVGPFVDRFEDMVATATGARSAVAVSSGTTGLHAALTAVGVGHGDLVILPAYTFIASANAVSHCGAAPWLFDMDRASWTLDPEQLRATLEAETERRNGHLVHRDSGRRVAAIMPVYAFGLPADMDAICETAAAFGLPVVADAAAAIGATYKGRGVGDLDATLSVFSFNGNKTVTGGGGGVISGDDALIKTVRHITTTAKTGPGYSHDQIGFNYRMTNLQAAVGCAQMERLDELVGAKRRIHEKYGAELGRISDLAPFPAPSWAESACWISGVVAPSDQEADKIRIALNAVGFSAQPFWMPMHMQVPYAGALAASLSVTEELWYRIIPLPNSANLSTTDQDLIILTLRQTAAGGPT
jgi:perosamine synthetase